MKNSKELLKNLVPGEGYLKATLKEGVAAFKPFSGDLYAVHIFIINPTFNITCNFIGIGDCLLKILAII